MYQSEGESTDRKRHTDEVNGNNSLKNQHEILLFKHTKEPITVVVVAVVVTGYLRM